MKRDVIEHVKKKRERERERERRIWKKREEFRNGK